MFGPYCLQDFDMFQHVNRARRTQTLPNRGVQKIKPAPIPPVGNKKKPSSLKNVDSKMANMILNEVVDKYVPHFSFLHGFLYHCHDAFFVRHFDVTSSL